MVDSSTKTPIMAIGIHLSKPLRSYRYGSSGLLVIAFEFYFISINMHLLWLYLVGFLKVANYIIWIKLCISLVFCDDCTDNDLIIAKT
jgi:hypothetical protein